MSASISLILEVVGLQTPRGRILFFLLASLAIFLVPYNFLANLSLWGHLGIDAPSIGLTRAYWHVMHFDIYAAWMRNPLIFLVLGIALPLLLFDSYRMYKRR